MQRDVSFGIEHNGQWIDEQQLDEICETVALFPNLSLKELALTVGEHLEWYTPTGTVKRDACLKLLLKLEAAGVVQLPEKRQWTKSAETIRSIEPSDATAAGERIEGALGVVGTVALEAVSDGEQKALWNEYVHRYHPLGYKQPFGYRLRYFIRSTRGPLGCVLVAGAAKQIGVRDRWIGWDDRQRLANLAWVVNNSRFLIFPWVGVKNLASHVLGLLAAGIREDWQRRWGYQPVLLESFVDPAHYRGSCYKAAGWREVGRTTGEGLIRPGKSYTTSPKIVFVKPLCRRWRGLLCSPDLRRRPDNSVSE